MTVADVIWLPQWGLLKISSALQTVTCLKCGCITRIQTQVIKSISFIVYYECPCRRQQNQEAVEMPFVIYFAKLCFFSLSPRSSGGPIRGGALMKADSQPDAGCERWSKAGRTNVCTHTSTLSLPARGDVKHNDVGRSWRRALCLPLPSQEAQKILMRGHGFIRMNTREPSSHMHSNLNDNKAAHESNPGCDWNDHLFLANTVNAGLFISLFCLVSIIVLHMSGPRSQDNPANRFKVPQIH